MVRAATCSAFPTFGSIDVGDIPVLSNGYKFGKMHMNGGEVFKFATRVIGESINQALDIAGLTIKDLKLIVPHQANARIMQAAARALKVDDSLFMSNIDRYGNTSAASIPIALCEAIQQGRIEAERLHRLRRLRRRLNVGVDGRPMGISRC